jgi:hypothetical protein
MRERPDQSPLSRSINRGMQRGDRATCRRAPSALVVPGCRISPVDQADRGLPAIFRGGAATGDRRSVGYAARKVVRVSRRLAATASPSFRRRRPPSPRDHARPDVRRRRPHMLMAKSALKESAAELDDGSAAVDSRSVARESPGAVPCSVAAGYRFGRRDEARAPLCPPGIPGFAIGDDGDAIGQCPPPDRREGRPHGSASSVTESTIRPKAAMA